MYAERVKYLLSFQCKKQFRQCTYVYKCNIEVH